MESLSVVRHKEKRAGFVATTKINRQDFGVSWQDTMDRGGIVVGNEIDITIDVEAILEDN